MPNKTEPLHGALSDLLNAEIPFEHRRVILAHFTADDDTASKQLVRQLLDRAARNMSEDVAELVKKLQEQIAELERGALRPATFLSPVKPTAGGVVRAQVALLNGEKTYPAVVDEELCATLECGDLVLVDAQARMLIGRDHDQVSTGEQGRLERRIDEDRVEVSIRDHALVLQVTALLRNQLDAGEVQPGARLLVCPQRLLALEAVRPADGLEHFQFLDRSPVPQVSIARDLADPPPFLFDVLEHVRNELKTPEIGRSYRIRRAMTKLLQGVSGSGKTYSLMGLIRAVYEQMAEHTGVPVEQLPKRVLRLRASSILSKWLGESDKAVDRFMDEVLQLADQTFTAPDGRTFELPVIVLGEEIDGLARHRGTAGDAVYDRVLTTLLERMDMNSRGLGDRLVVMLCTSNTPHLIDAAFLRRIGGTVEKFGRLNRRGFAQVLLKHLNGLPLAADLGDDDQQRLHRLLGGATDWLFASNGHDPGQLELTYVNSAQPVTFFRRAFLTAGLVDRAVQQAAQAACRLQRAGQAEPGVTLRQLLEAFDHQVRAIVEQCTEHNVENYLTLRAGERVSRVRRIQQPPIVDYELDRAGR
jgi:ATP-dependent 26S proteasome regulatory subunit